ncbi:peroxisomal membrane protein 11B [Asbolus verrucosus]|uniref:Peroxisomal membrane protein 11B n=1 Tax=Asbolus verrucosus TaxID=1661398 RepID=A0A482WBW9_ASBVE|nr:peroxisomal membrane protein 11B [Asbolus verrucosus]
MDTLVKLNNQTAGRDKIARLVQYLSRVLWHRLRHSNKDQVNAFKNLEFQLSTFRKLLRFGKCFDVLYSTLPLFDHPDATVRHSLILSKIALSLFLIGDHLLWLGRADVCTINTQKWSRISNKYWLYSITMNLVRDFYEISCIIKSQKQSIIPSSGIQNFNDLYKILIRTVMVLQSNRTVMIDTVKNGCDFFIPLTALGHVNMSPGTVGWLGVISSIAGLLVLIEPKVKLSPA